MHKKCQWLLAFAATSLLVNSATALQAGMSTLNVAGQAAGQPATAVVLYYPTQAAARAIPMGPFTPVVALGAAPEPQVKGLIVLSHGAAGSELGHGRLAEALAQAGYLVAALRHPMDNWQDQSMLQGPSARYFGERPRQVSRVIDALLQDPQWKDRIAQDAVGPKVGALGHSAGGYTVLALAGGQPDVRRLAEHCGAHLKEDPIFCRTGGRDTGAASGDGAAATGAPAQPAVADPRVRSAVALAPVGVVFTASSLSAVKVPVAVYAAADDTWLVPRFHSRWIAQHLAGAQMHNVPQAGHFAFMDKPSMPILTDGGDIAADPPGFDRTAFLANLSQALVAFFDRTL